jgi:hypothetical protein
MLITLKFTGILTDPYPTETITLDAVNWQMERPSVSINLFENITCNYSDSIMTTAIVEIPRYYEGGLSFFDSDGIEFYVNVSVTEGVATVISVEYDLMDTNQFVWISDDSLELVSSNATITGMKQFGINESDAHLQAEVVSCPCYLASHVFWGFLDGDGTHGLEVVFKIMYFNGTTYRQVILPMQISMWADAGNNFENAAQIIYGNYTGYVGIGMPPPWCDDLDDYYMLWAEEGTNIRVKMVQMANATNIDFDLYFYGPNKELLASSRQPRPNTAEVIVQTIEVTSWYYIRVEAAFGFGLYSLEITS